MGGHSLALYLTLARSLSRSLSLDPVAENNPAGTGPGGEVSPSQKQIYLRKLSVSETGSLSRSQKQPQDPGRRGTGGRGLYLRSRSTEVSLYLRNRLSIPLAETTGLVVVSATGTAAGGGPGGEAGGEDGGVGVEAEEEVVGDQVPARHPQVHRVPVPGFSIDL